MPRGAPCWQGQGHGVSPCPGGSPGCHMTFLSWCPLKAESEHFRVWWIKGYKQELGFSVGSWEQRLGIPAVRLPGFPLSVFVWLLGYFSTVVSSLTLKKGQQGREDMIKSPPEEPDDEAEGKKREARSPEDHPNWGSQTGWEAASNQTGGWDAEASNKGATNPVWAVCSWGRASIFPLHWSRGRVPLAGQMDDSMQEVGADLSINREGLIFQ